jgi:molybdopterin molybdotransferase
MTASLKTPCVLRVLETVKAGSVARRRVEPGTAIRIMTGAPVPGGADSVVQFENTDEARRTRPSDGRPPREIGILAGAEPGLNIRQAGEDVARGAKVLKAGTVIRPAEVGVLASLGMTRVNVIRRPVVAVLATGNELVPVGRALSPCKIYNSNSYSVAALVRRYGGIPRLLGIALDKEASLLSKLRQAMDADMLITTGGVSAGDYDIVKDILAREGEIAFWTVRMKPGKPMAFGAIRGVGKDGRARRVPHLGLPGNPVSSMVCFELYARPAMLKMMGRRNLAKPVIDAVLGDTVVNTDGRRIYNRAVVEKRGNGYFARLTGPQGSGILTSMSLANGLAIIPEDRASVEAGETVKVMMLDGDE